ncbi:4Fe-4S binding protein [Thermosulfuriphilus sp.]
MNRTAPPEEEFPQRPEAGRSRLKEILRTILIYDPEARVNLFEVFPALRSFFANRRYFAWIRTATDILFASLIFAGLFGPQDPERNAMLFVAWGLWWTSVVISWFFLGRMWCAFCPFPGLGRLLQGLSFSRKKLPPHWFSRYCAYIATGLLAFIIWIEAVTDMKHSPMGTALLLLSIAVGATVLAIFYRGQAWCRHFCPMGKIIGSAATLSILEFRADHNRCRGCRTFECKRGRAGTPGCPVYLGAFNVRNNLICLICGHCVPLCQRGSPRLNIRHSLNELILNKGRYLTCTYIIPFLMGSQVARFLQDSRWYPNFRNFLGGSEAVAFTLILTAGFIFFLGLIKLGARLFTVHEDELFGRFSPMVPVLVPLAFTGELAYRLEYLLREAGDFLPTLGRQFGFSWEHLAFEIPSGLIGGLSIFILILGALGGLHVTYVFYRQEFEGLVPQKNYFLINVLVLLSLGIYIWIGKYLGSFFL